MKKTFKWLIVLSVCISMVLAFSVTGCKKEAPAEVETVEEEAPAEEAAKKPVTLYFFQYAPEYTNYMNEMAEEYNSVNPNVTIEFEINQDQYNTLLKTKLNSGNLPDAFWIEGLNNTKLYADYAYDLTNEPFMENVLPSALTQVTIDGKVLGYPLWMQSYSIIYNKKIFSDAGITELPATLTELRDVCEILKSKGIPAFVNGYKEWWVFKHIMSHFIAAEEGDYAGTAASIAAGTKKLEDLKYFNNFFDLIDITVEYGLPKPLEADFNTEIADFTNGKGAMMTGQGDWAEISVLKIDPDFQMGYIGQPVGDDASKAKIMADSSTAWLITKDNENVEEVLAWLDWLTTSDYGKSFISKVCKVTGVLKDSPPADTQLAIESTEFLSSNRSYPWIQTYWPNGFDQKLGELMQAYIAKIKTKDQVLSELNSSWQKLATE